MKEFEKCTTSEKVWWLYDHGLLHNELSNSKFLKDSSYLNQQYALYCGQRGCTIDSNRSDKEISERYWDKANRFIEDNPNADNPKRTKEEEVALDRWYRVLDDRRKEEEHGYMIKIAIFVGVLVLLNWFVKK